MATADGAGATAGIMNELGRPSKSHAKFISPGG
jgi:hypothetical protein